MRSRKDPALLIVMTTVLLAAVWAAPRTARGQSVPGRAVSTAGSAGLAAVDAAARNGKYLFLFFWKQNDENTRSMYQVFQSAMGKWADSVDSIGISTADPKEKPVVEKFGVSRAPMPLVLALAPNGAITKAFPVRFAENDFQQAFVSPCTAKCLRALQQRKLVLLCVQNPTSQFNEAALRGARDFKADARFASTTELITLNSADQAESSFLRDLQVDPRSPTAMTVLLAPPGKPIARLAGAVSKEQIVAKLTTAQSSCCPGGQCGPNGCGPAQ